MSGRMLNEPRNCGCREAAMCQHAVIFVDKRGLYEKFRVTRSDGSSLPPEAQVFVLCVDSDPAARVALEAYADALADTGKEKLMADIRLWLRRLPGLP